MTKTNDVVIAAAARTAIGNFMGAYATEPATSLGAQAIKAAVERSGCPAEEIDEVLMGCVLPAGLGQAPARQSAIRAGLPVSTGCVTINKVCGSGLKAVMLAHDSIVAGENAIVVAGGMESMTRAPHLLLKGRSGIRYGHDKLFDHMALDGLEDAYESGLAMGVLAEKCAGHYAFSRAAQDAFSITSVERAQKAIAEGAFKDEITPYVVKTRKGEINVDTDEKPGTVKKEKIPALRPAFARDGTVTAGSSSAISDGAAALVVMRAEQAAAMGIKPLARIVAHDTYAREPEWFTRAPVGSVASVLKKAGWAAADVDLFEINEAFAVVTMAAMRELDLAHARVNIHGGAVALGHPIGASGARILVTLLYALRRHNKKRGVASLCIGGGEAVSVAVECV